MKKIAILFDGNIYDQKGYFNAVRNRIKYLNLIADFDIDVYIYCIYEPFYIRMLRGSQKQEKIDSILLDNLKCKIIWQPFSLIDYILGVKFKLLPIFRRLFLRRQVNRFKDYNLLNVHSSDCGSIALMVKNKFSIPYCVTWHGSDIHSAPFSSNFIKKMTKQVIEEARCNFFVSEALLNKSNQITNKGCKVILYNGASDEFRILTNRDELRSTYSNGKKIIGFIGNVIPIKNVLSLPEIFARIYSVEKEVEFWIVGNGKLERQLKMLTEGLPVKFWGKKSPGEVPALLNCIDVLILPSYNEGLPLVIVEALKCGCNVVGSDVGGIAEVIGKNNVFPLKPIEQFYINVADRCLAMLASKITQQLPPCFNWQKTAIKEADIIHNIIF